MSGAGISGILGPIDVGILSYFVLVNTLQLALVCLAALDTTQYRRRRPFAGFNDAYRSALTPPVSILMPAYNEAACIVEAVRASLALRYPRFELIVIDDGSTDGTFERLRAHFDLVVVPRVIPRDVAVRGVVRSVHLPARPVGSDPETLVVVRKDNGGKADAVNTGINLARHPLVCMVDADSVLDPDALLSVVKPFIDEPARVAATGGVVRVANGCRVLAGRIVETAMPRQWLARIQVVEYLRSFLLGRTGWSRVGGLVIISGAFGVFRRDLLIELGGVSRDCIGEDAELVVRLHRRLRERRADYDVVFVAEPVAWSEVPTTARILSRQRRRWHRGITEILIRHRVMLGRPRYGRIGLVVLPYYVVFEVLAPLVELSAVVLIPVALAVNAVDFAFAGQFLLVAYVYAILVSLVAVVFEELSFHRYHRWSDLVAIVLAAILENLGYRQFTAVCQLRGSWDAVRGRKHVWGTMPRAGFTGAELSRSS